MRGLRAWLWWRFNNNTTKEAQETLAEVDGRQDAVDDLNERLRDALRHNHFSDLVTDVIKRAREGESS